MLDPEDVLNSKDGERRRNAQLQSAKNAARTFGETFNTPAGRKCLAIMREHFFGYIGDPRDRRDENTNDIIRRDTFRDAYLWIEGLAMQGEREA